MKTKEFCNQCRVYKKGVVEYLDLPCEPVDIDLALCSSCADEWGLK